MVTRHFEAVFVACAWLNAAVLAVLVGRPWLGALGILTVAPFIVVYAARERTITKR